MHFTLLSSTSEDCLFEFICIQFARNVEKPRKKEIVNLWNFSSNKNVSSMRKQTVVFPPFLAHCGIFKAVFNTYIHKEIYLRNAGIGRFPCQLTATKRLQTSNCCKKKRTQADDTSQNTLSEKRISLHKEGTLDQPCSEEAFSVRLVSLVMGSSSLRLSVMLIGFSPYPPILLSLDLYSQNSWPSLQELPGVVLQPGFSSQTQAVGR